MTNTLTRSNVAVETSRGGLALWEIRKTPGVSAAKKGQWPDVKWTASQ